MGESAYRLPRFCAYSAKTGTPMTRLCKICGQPIHPERLAVSPRTLTDTAKCAAENTRLLRNAATRRWQKKKREAVPAK